MSSSRALDTIETPRLILRHQAADDAEVYRRLWTERDPRVPAHRRINLEGRPSVEDIAAQIAEEQEGPGPGLLAVQRKDTADVIGYCGLIIRGDGPPDEPDLAYELLRASHGYGFATEAGRAVAAWADAAGYRRLWAGVWDWNVQSRRVLAKLEFREVGRAGPDSIHGHSLLTVRDRARLAQ